MDDNQLFIYKSIVNDMSEGVFTVNMKGKITSINPAARLMLGLEMDVIGKSFAQVFFGQDENDEFIQSILDAIYHGSTSHNAIVRYTRGFSRRQFFINTSYLKNNDESVGIAAVINDITELTQLRDAVKAMEQIRSLNFELEKRNKFIKKAFGRYLSDAIVEEILDNEDGLEIGGKKQIVSMLFSDIRGFTALSERMQPQDLIAMLNNYLEKMIEIIMYHRGTILEFIGDAIVIVFGAPIENGNSDFDAVACGIEMQREMKRVNEYNRKNGYPEIEMGIGIHTGEVVVGNIGSNKKTKYDMIGKNVNLTSRIETYTVGGQILVSETVKNNIGPALITDVEMSIMPKGVASPVNIYGVRSLDIYQMPSSEQHFTSLSPAVVINYRCIDGKHNKEEYLSGTIIEKSEKEFVLQTEYAIEEHSNITFMYNGNEFYAKSVGERNGGVLMHLTSGKSSDICSDIY